MLENPLQTPVSIEEERSASASLGEDSIKSGVYAGLLGLALIFVAVLFYYRLAGLVALIALAVEGVLLFGLLAMFGAVLTLPGIAGIILTLGMAIDANVLIYERLREEVAAGKSLKTALDDVLPQGVLRDLRFARHHAHHGGDPLFAGHRPGDAASPSR